MKHSKKAKVQSTAHLRALPNPLQFCLEMRTIEVLEYPNKGNKAVEGFGALVFWAVFVFWAPSSGGAGGV